MKFTTAASAVAFAAVVSAQTPCEIARGSMQADFPWVYPLYKQCTAALKDQTDFANLWSHKACVAAAVVSTPGIVRDAESCQAASLPALTAQGNMPFSLYQTITGSQSDKVFINQQNLIDLVYSTIQTESSPVWPVSNSEVIGYLQQVFDWTATGATIPYSHFSDFLKYSPERVHPVTSSSRAPFTSTLIATGASTAVVNATTVVATPASTAVVNATTVVATPATTVTLPPVFTSAA